jgi:hypothetical protein
MKMKHIWRYRFLHPYAMRIIDLTRNLLFRVFSVGSVRINRVEASVVLGQVGKHVPDGRHYTRRENDPHIFPKIVPTPPNKLSICSIPTSSVK